MKPFTYHTHTLFCDGKNTVDEMTEGAIALGCDAIGFSGHSFVPLDAEYCMPTEKLGEYKREVEAAREKYKDKIKVYLGIEQDISSDVSIYESGYDYKIGSVHGIIKNGKYYSIDASEADFVGMAQKLYGGDFYSLCEEYFSELARVYDVTKCDIVGHLDLVTKFNENCRIFDDKNERYLKSAGKAIKKLASDGVIFEINTGAMSRGYRKTPYPSRELLEIIKREGGRVTYSSDSHTKDGVLCGYDNSIKLAKECGFEGFMKLERGEFKLVRFDEILPSFYQL